MDRLVKAEVQELNLLFIKGQKCCANFKLTNLMHTMSVAISLTTTNSSLFSFSQAFSIIPPLSTSSHTLFLSNSNNDKLALPASPDAILVRSTMLPTGKANEGDLRRLFSKPGSHIFKDATIPVYFVGCYVIESFLSYQSRSLETNFLFQKAVSWCDQSQLDSLLNYAAEIGNTHYVSGLIAAGADVNCRAKDGHSAMSKAVKSGNLDTIQVLIESGCKVDNRFDRFLHDAAAMGRVDVMELLWLGFTDLDLNLVDSEGHTALHIAAIRRHERVLEFLVSSGCDPDIVDSKGWTPLHYAAYNGHSKAVRILSDHSVYAKHALNAEGKTPFGLAVEQGHKHLYDLLHFGDVINRASRIGDVNGIKNCLAEGGDVNCRDQNGWTPLHRAAFKGQFDCVEILLKNGAEIDGADDDGYTPLHLALEAGQYKVAVFLISHGAKANVKSLEEKFPNDYLNSSKKHFCVVKPVEQQ